MRKYRIKQTPFFNNGYAPEYKVQVKFRWVPIWLPCTFKFRKLEEAKKYIELIKEEY